MDKMLNLITPGIIESKAVVPMGYAKIPVSFLAGYNENEEHLIFRGGKVIVASESLKISDSRDGAKVEEIISNGIDKDCFFHYESDGKCYIAFNKYELIILRPSIDTKNVVVDLQNLFDEFCALTHLGTDVNNESNFYNATLNFDLCDSFPPNLETLQLNRTSVSGGISKLGNLTKLTNLALGQTSVSGDIESFVQAQRAAGRSSASLTGSSINWGEVTFDGSLTKGGLSWTSTTITMNGKTINA